MWPQLQNVEQFVYQLIGKSPSRSIDPLSYNAVSTSKPLSTSNSIATPSTNELIDLEAIVLNWAKQIFEVTKTRGEAKINKKHLKFNINWSHLVSETYEPKYRSDQLNVPGGGIGRSKSEQCLFRSSFTNTTDREQEYSFKTERSTRSTATVVIEKGVCRGVEMSLKLKTPCEVVEGNAGFHAEMSVIHIGENTVEEELTWGVDSTVRVPQFCEAVAELVIIEDHQTRRFTVESILSGQIIVTVTNLKDNNSLVTIIEGKIADIIRGMPNFASLGFTVQNDIVSFVNQGVCKFKYGVEQRVKITERNLNRSR